MQFYHPGKKCGNFYLVCKNMAPHPLGPKEIDGLLVPPGKAYMAPHPLGPKEIDGLLVPPGKAYTPLTDHLITD